MRDRPEQYRVLWRSGDVLNYPLLVQNSVPLGVAERVQQAFVDMANDETGRAILAQVNQRSGIKWLGWDKASEADYASAIAAYRQLGAQDQ
jgi:ABC-type phosphate/phosphonate transport system substrate-binding protein